MNRIPDELRTFTVKGSRNGGYRGVDKEKKDNEQGGSHKQPGRPMIGL
jgi:hypothetical protein